MMTTWTEIVEACLVTAFVLLLAGSAVALVFGSWRLLKTGVALSVSVFALLVLGFVWSPQIQQLEERLARERHDAGLLAVNVTDVPTLSPHTDGMKFHYLVTLQTGKEYEVASPIRLTDVEAYKAVVAKYPEVGDGVGFVPVPAPRARELK